MDKHSPPPRPIEASFSKDGFQFTLRNRSGNICLFSKTKPQFTNPTFEVVKLVIAEERTFPNGKTAPRREILPKSEDWGRYGWSYGDYQSAQRKYLELT